MHGPCNRTRPAQGGACFVTSAILAGLVSRHRGNLANRGEGEGPQLHTAHAWETCWIRVPPAQNLFRCKCLARGARLPHTNHGHGRQIRCEYHVPAYTTSNGRIMDRNDAGCVKVPTESEGATKARWNEIVAYTANHHGAWRAGPLASTRGGTCNRNRRPNTRGMTRCVAKRFFV